MRLFHIILFSLLFITIGVINSQINSISFSIPELIYSGDPVLGNTGDQFLAAEIDPTTPGKEFCFRSKNKLFVYSLTGTELWSVKISNPGGNGGAKHGAADVDGDGVPEVVAIDYPNQIRIYNGPNGSLETSWIVNELGEGQRVGHMALVKLQDANQTHYDIIVQTLDATGENDGPGYYLNRSLIAMDLRNGKEIWRVTQDATSADGFYEGYWGQAHGPLFCADVDEDGLDEVVGGNVIDHDGTSKMNDYPTFWVRSNNVNYVDHLDAISVGDFRQDIPGLEWVICEEDNNDNVYYHTAMLSMSRGMIWRQMATSIQGLLGASKNFEPQNLVGGNFDLMSPQKEIWNRSRIGKNDAPSHTQLPWIYDAEGSLIAHYRADETLGAGFNASGNAEGIEMIWGIDWDGGPVEYLAGKARHAQGNIGVFDAMTGLPVWYTSRELPSVRALMIYVADVTGDSREEIIVEDSTSSGPVIRIYQNTATTKAIFEENKWDDPLYMHLKQVWNYYSPGSYTRREEMYLTVKCYLEGAFDAGLSRMSESLSVQARLPFQSPYSEDPETLTAIPAHATDWILLQLVDAQTGTVSYEKSCFINRDGYLVLNDTDGTILRLDCLPGTYAVQLKHRNHLTVRSRSTVQLISRHAVSYDFSSSAEQTYGSKSSVLLALGVYGIPAGDVNGDTYITVGDLYDIYSQENLAGYYPGDINCDGIVNTTDCAFVFANRNLCAQQPGAE